MFEYGKVNVKGRLTKETFEKKVERFRVDASRLKEIVVLNEKLDELVVRRQKESIQFVLTDDEEAEKLNVD